MPGSLGLRPQPGHCVSLWGDVRPRGGLAFLDTRSRDPGSSVSEGGVKTEGKGKGTGSGVGWRVSGAGSRGDHLAMKGAINMGKAS